jgi:ComEC/Rec2-related protein
MSGHFSAKQAFGVNRMNLVLSFGKTEQEKQKMPSARSTPASGGILDPLPIPEKHSENAAPSPSREREKKIARKSKPQPLLNRYESFLIPALVLFMLGNALAYALPELPFVRPGIGLSLCGLLIGLIIYTAGQGSRARWKIRLSLWLMALIGGGLYYQQFHFQPGVDDVSTFAPAEHVQVAGTVEAMSGKNRAVVRVRTINGQPATGQVLATLPNDKAGALQEQPGLPEAGTRVLITADLARPFHSRIPGAFDQERYLAAQQITAVLKRPERLVFFEASNEPRYILQRATDHLKDRIAGVFARTLPSPQAEVLGGIVLGDKAIPLDRDTRQAFIQTGLVHILAASGMNVGIIAAAVLWLLSRLKCPYRVKLLAAMVAVAFYSLLTGLPPSIQRAATMLEIALILKFLNRSLSPTLLLCVAGSVLLLFYPDHIGSIGFQFSMLTTFGLVTMVSPLQEKLGYYITRWLAGLILVPLVAQIWVWPLSVFYFNQFPLHSVPLNLLALLMVTPLTLLGFSAAAISTIIPAVGGWLSWLSLPFVNALLLLVQWGDSMAWAKWMLPSPSPILLILLYVQLFIILGLLHRCKKMPLPRKLLMALLPLAAMLGLLCLQKELAQKDAQISLLPLSFRHEGYLIKPAGLAQYLAVLPSDLTYFESSAVASYLRRRNISSLEALILLPEHQADMAPERAARASLKVLGQVSVKAILTTPAIAENLNASAEKLIPSNGAELQLGSLSIRAQFPNLQVISGRCLLELTTRYQSNSPCGVQVVQDPSSLRLFSAVPLDAGQYYELRQQADRLRLY